MCHPQRSDRVSRHKHLKCCPADSCPRQSEVQSNQPPASCFSSQFTLMSQYATEWEQERSFSVYRDTFLQCSFFFLDKSSAIIHIFCSITDMKSEDFTFPRLDSNEAVSRCAADGSALARCSTQVFYFTLCAGQHKIQSSGDWDPCSVLKGRNLPRFLSHYQKRLQLYL